MKTLKDLRNKIGISQMEMAKRLSITYSHYTKLENNFVNPSFKLLKKIKEEFSELDMNDFFE